MHRYLAPMILILISVLVSFFYYPKASMMFEKEELLEQKDSNSPESNDEQHNVRWSTLQKLDYKKNHIEDESLKKIINSSVKIPGFAVPLTDNLQSVSEFLLVPNQQACIHVPPPPPNLIVFVRLDKPAKIEDLIGPLWVSGILRLKTLQSIYGSSSYELEKVKVEPYEF